MANRDPLHIIKFGTNNEGDTREEYMLKLRKWCAEAQQHNMQMQALWQNYYMLYLQSSQGHNVTEIGTSQVPPSNQTPANGSGYYIYTIPPMWKRVAAELIDFLVLFVFKMLLTIFLLENFELLDLDNYTLSALEEHLQNPTIATRITLEIFTLEVIHRIIVCFYEAYWLALEGATPGKKAMRLTVINAISTHPTAELDRVLVYPCTFLTFKDALLRSLLKNVCVGLLFPICFVLLFFKFNRTGYDLVTNSLVVEHHSNLPLVQQQN